MHEIIIRSDISWFPKRWVSQGSRNLVRDGIWTSVWGCVEMVIMEGGVRVLGCGRRINLYFKARTIWQWNPHIFRFQLTAKIREKSITFECRNLRPTTTTEFHPISGHWINLPLQTIFAPLSGELSRNQRFDRRFTRWKTVDQPAWSAQRAETGNERMFSPF